MNKCANKGCENEGIHKCVAAVDPTLKTVLKTDIVESWICEDCYSLMLGNKAREDISVAWAIPDGQETDQIIKKVYYFVNNMVAVTDQFGKQIPKYQGPYHEVHDQILKDAPAETEFFGGRWEGRIVNP